MGEGGRIWSGRMEREDREVGWGGEGGKKEGEGWRREEEYGN